MADSATESMIELAPLPRQEVGFRVRSGAAGGPVAGGSPDESPDETSSARHEFSLPPVDSGKDAWLFLAACFSIEALVWGFPFAFGVFQKYYTSHEPFAGSENIAVIGTCAMGIMYLSSPIIVTILKTFPRTGRWAPIVGLLIMCIALAMSSFSRNVTHLIVTQGILYAIGGCIAYCPCIMYMDEWFVRRKGFAYGIMWSGTGLAGVLFPLFLEHLLGTRGFEFTLRLWACMLFVLTAPLAFFIKPRLPVAPSARARPVSLRFVFSRVFALHQLANIVEAMGFFLPGIYMPIYAQSALDASPLPSALTIMLINVASVFGCVAMGHLVDRLHVTTCIMLSTIGATVGVFLLWGFSNSLAVLYVFCIMYGFFAGAYSSAWPGIIKQITSDEAYGDHTIDPSLVFAFLAAGRGVGNVISGPLSEALIKGLPWKGQAASAYGSGYGTLIAFTGATAVFGGTSFLWKRLGLM